MWVVVYVLVLVAINWGFAHVPLVILPWGDAWPPLSLAVGLVFALRDLAQREVGHGVLLAMLAGVAISYVLADPFVALASAAAFAVSELADWSVYTWTRRPFAARVLLSSAISTPLDSLVFLAMIGHATPAAVAVMTASKMVAALVVWRLAVGRERARLRERLL